MKEHFKNVIFLISFFTWIVTKILPGEPTFDPDTTMGFTRTLMGSIILIPYMLKSKRVRATFVAITPKEQIPTVTESVG